MLVELRAGVERGRVSQLVVVDVLIRRGGLHRLQPRVLLLGQIDQEVLGRVRARRRLVEHSMSNMQRLRLRPRKLNWNDWLLKSWPQRSSLRNERSRIANARKETRPRNLTRQNELSRKPKRLLHLHNNLRQCPCCLLW